MPTGDNRQDGQTEEKQVDVHEQLYQAEQAVREAFKVEDTLYTAKQAEKQLKRLKALDITTTEPEKVQMESPIDEALTQEEIDDHNDTLAEHLRLFTKSLEGIINEYSMENWCDIPDFILAEMITKFIVTTGKSVKKTLTWHGTDSICHNIEVRKEEAYIEGYKKWQEGANNA